MQVIPALLPEPKGPLIVPATVEARDGVRLSVVVPTFNEAKNVRELVRRLSTLLDPRLDGSYEIVVVDDDSPDETWRVALEASREFPRLRVMRRTRDRDLSTAVVRGWQVARGDALAVIDGDLQHPPEIMLDLWRIVERGADLAVASRHVEGGGVSDWSLRRRLLSRGAQLLGLALLPEVVGRVSDPMSGYFMVRRAALANRELHPVGYKILVEVLARADIGLVGETGYVFAERSIGDSKVTWQVYRSYLRHLVRLRRDRRRA